MNFRIREIVALCSFTLIFLGLSACSHQASENPVLRNVILTSPLLSGSETNSEFSGNIEEGKSVNASFMAEGKINHLYVKEGDRIKKGQLIASLDDSDYQIGVNQLMAQFNQMTEEKKRMDEMFSRHNIAPNDYEKFSAGYEQLKLQLEMVQKKLGYTKLYSPTDGYVAQKFMEPGELVGAGTPIFKITDDSNLIVNVDLPISVFLNRENIKSASGISPALQESNIPLSVESFTPDPSNTMLYQMKLSIPSSYTKMLSPGMNIRVKIDMKKVDSDGFLIPCRSIFNDNGANYVWVFNPNDSTILKKEITITGMPQGDIISVRGLDGTERIVETGVKQLYQGEKVNISHSSDYNL